MKKIVGAILLTLFAGACTRSDEPRTSQNTAQEMNTGVAPTDTNVPTGTTGTTTAPNSVPPVTDERTALPSRDATGNTSGTQVGDGTVKQVPSDQVPSSQPARPSE